MAALDSAAVANGVFAVLLLAFLQPVLKRFGADPADRTGRQVLIVFDHSVSMEHKGDGPTSRERAVHEAGKLMDSLGPEDTVNILLMEPKPPTCFVSFSKDTAEAKRFLSRLKPGFGRADVNLRQHGGRPAFFPARRAAGNLLSFGFRAEEMGQRQFHHAAAGREIVFRGCRPGAARQPRHSGRPAFAD